MALTTNAERRFVPQTKASIRQSDENKIVGYASVYFNESDPATQFDLFGDGSVLERIVPGAFDEVISGEEDVRGLFNHDPNYVLGRTTAGTLTLTSDETGFHYDTDTPDTQVGRDTKTLIDRGDITGSSFSFYPDLVEWKEETINGRDVDVRYIKRARVADVGPVTFPAYEGTTANARSKDDVHAEWQAWQEEKQRLRADDETGEEDDVEPTTPDSDLAAVADETDDDMVLVNKRRAEIFIYGMIGSWWDGLDAYSLARRIDNLDVDEIVLRINSPGGYTDDGAAIYNSLKRHSAKVIAEIEGGAYSAASEITMAADEIRMHENAFLMIHNAWTIEIGEAKDFQSTANHLFKLNKVLGKVYESRSNLPLNKIKKMMDETTYLMADECLEMGFCDKVIPNKGGEADKAERCRVEYNEMRNRVESLERFDVSQLASDLEVRLDDVITLEARDVSVGSYQIVGTGSMNDSTFEYTVSPTTTPTTGATYTQVDVDDEQDDDVDGTEQINALRRKLRQSMV